MGTLSLRPTSHSQIYEQDFALWLAQTVQLLHDRNFSDLDIDNLVEEIETMGRSDRHRLKSNLKIVLIHLLKYKYQPEKRTNSWIYTLVEHRQRLNEQFKDSPSLRKYSIEEFADTYLAARKLASIETGMAIAFFPMESPFTLEQTLDEDYFPED
jgi:hypothetical protein